MSETSKWFLFAAVSRLISLARFLYNLIYSYLYILIYIFWYSDLFQKQIKLQKNLKLFPWSSLGSWGPGGRDTVRGQAFSEAYGWGVVPPYDVGMWTVSEQFLFVSVTKNQSETIPNTTHTWSNTVTVLVLTPELTCLSAPWVGVHWDWTKIHGQVSSPCPIPCRFKFKGRCWSMT